jgi:beta-lactam-binding protein with PASTA domain
MPMLVGMKEDDAWDSVYRAGLCLGIIHSGTGHFAPGHIVEQSPAAGTALAPKAVVSYTVKLPWRGYTYYRLPPGCH